MFSGGMSNVMNYIYVLPLNTHRVTSGCFSVKLTSLHVKHLPIWLPKSIKDGSFSFQNYDCFCMYLCLPVTAVTSYMSTVMTLITFCPTLMGMMT